MNICTVCITGCENILWSFGSDSSQSLTQILSWDFQHIRCSYNRMRTDLIFREKRIADACHKHHRDQERDKCFWGHDGAGPDQQDNLDAVRSKLYDLSYVRSEGRAWLTFRLDDPLWRRCYVVIAERPYVRPKQQFSRNGHKRPVHTKLNLRWKWYWNRLNAITVWTLC